MTKSTPCSYGARRPSSLARTTVIGAPAPSTVWYSGWTRVLSGATAKSPLSSGWRQTVIRSMSPGRNGGSPGTRTCAAADATNANSSAATTHWAPRRIRLSLLVSGSITDLRPRRIWIEGAARNVLTSASDCRPCPAGPHTGDSVAKPLRGRWQHGLGGGMAYAFCLIRERRLPGVLKPLSKAAFACLWCFVFVLPWDMYTDLPVVGSIPRLVGIVASAVGVLYIVARRRVRPLSWFHVFVVLFVLWAAVTTLWSVDSEATQKRLMTYLQLALLVWLIWEIAWSPQRTRALLGAYVLGVSVAAVATVHDYLSGVHATGYPGRFNGLSVDPNELGVTLALGLPMAWYLSLSQRQRRVAWLWQLYLPLAITAILLTASRGAF